MNTPFGQISKEDITKERNAIIELVITFMLFWAFLTV